MRKSRFSNEPGRALSAWKSRASPRKIAAPRTRGAGPGLHLADLERVRAELALATEIPIRETRPADSKAQQEALMTPLKQLVELGALARDLEESAGKTR